MSLRDIGQVSVIGRARVDDAETNEEIMDWTCNAVHSINLATIFARGLAHMSNSNAFRFAYGNGGTSVSTSNQIIFNLPNDGINDNAGWESTLYNETYSEIIDATQPSLLGTGPGAYPPGDEPSTLFVSGPGCTIIENSDNTTTLRVESFLNKDEPYGQNPTDGSGPLDTESPFVFDEIGIFTAGAPKDPTAGYQFVSVGDKNIDSPTGLNQNTDYYFNIQVDGGAVQPIVIHTPSVGSGSLGEIMYSDLISLLNTSGMTGAVASISDAANNVNTYGYLKFTSNSVGPLSAILLSKTPTMGSTLYLFERLADFGSQTGGVLPSPVPGKAAGVRLDPVNYTTERERLLCHLIFSPIQKAGNRAYRVTYELTIQVKPSQSSVVVP